MSAIEVTANKGQKTLTVNYDFGDNLQDAIAKFGEDVVFSNMQQSMKISLQALLRRGFDKGISDEEITAQAATWKPGVAAQRSSDPVAAIMSKWASIPAEKRAELMKQLKSQM